MKRSRFYFLQLALAVALLCLGGCNENEEAQTGSIAGFVLDANTGEPVRAANITLSPVGLSAVSGSDGMFEFVDLKAGKYNIQASKSGYITNTKTVIVSEGRVASGDIMLTPSSGEMSLSVSYIDFGTSQTVASFQIQNNAANGTFQWSVVKEGTADWLTVSPTSGTTGAGQQSPVTLTVDRQLVTTSQTVNLRVTNNTSGNSIALPVSVGYSSGTLTVTPNPVDFGTTALTRQMTIHNSGSTTVNYEINYDCAWLTVSPVGGTVSAGSSVTVSLALNRDAFTGSAQTILQVRNTADGSYTSVTVTATNDGGSQGGDIVVPGGLQCYYTFDNNTANDLTDNGIDAQLMNSATITTNSGRLCLKLNQVTDDYLNIPYNLFSGLTNWSVCFWIKDFGPGNIFSGWNTGSGSAYGDAPLFWAMQDGKFKLKCRSEYMPDGGTQFAYNYTSSQSDGSWHHVVVTISASNNSGTAKLYVDGSLRDQITLTYHTNTIGDATKIAFGGSKDGLYPFSSSMKLDNIRIYNRTISNTEVQTIYNNEL